MGSAIATRDKSLVEQAFEMAAPVADTSGLKEELDALTQVKGHLLPVEEAAKTRVVARIQELSTVLKQARFAEKMLPLEPLSWRWKNGLPKLALLSLGSPSINITGRRDKEGDTWHSIAPQLPERLADAYDDVARLAKSYCVRPDSSRSYTFRFDGVIPASARASVKEAMESYRFEGLYMLVEAPEEQWKIETQKGTSRREAARERRAALLARLANLDPLILGWAEEALWVIDKFDLTTLEQYVLDEFSQKALLPGS